MALVHKTSRKGTKRRGWVKWRHSYSGLRRISIRKLLLKDNNTAKDSLCGNIITITTSGFRSSVEVHNINKEENIF